MKIQNHIKQTIGFQCDVFISRFYLKNNHKCTYGKYKNYLSYVTYKGELEQVWYIQYVYKIAILKSEKMK